MDQATVSSLAANRFARITIPSPLSIPPSPPITISPPSCQESRSCCTLRRPVHRHDPLTRRIDHGLVQLRPVYLSAPRPSCLRFCWILSQWRRVRVSVHRQVVCSYTYSEDRLTIEERKEHLEMHKKWSQHQGYTSALNRSPTEVWVLCYIPRVATVVHCIALSLIHI